MVMDRKLVCLYIYSVDLKVVLHHSTTGLTKEPHKTLKNKKQNKLKQERKIN